MIPVALIPLAWKLAGAGLLVAAAWGAWQWHGSSRFDDGVKHQQAEQNRIDLKRSEAAANALAERHAKDEATAERLQKAEDEASQAEARQRADKLIADAATGDLRRRFEQRLRDAFGAVYAAAANRPAGTENPTAASGSASADDPAGVLADVYGRCLQQRQRFAEIADERGRAGALCEAAYDALTPTPTN